MNTEILGVPVNFLVSAFSSLGAFTTVVIIWQALLETNPFADKARALTSRREELRTLQLAPRRRNWARSLTFLERVVRVFKLASQGQVKAAQLKLTRAGFRRQIDITIYLGLRILSPLVTTAFALAALSWFGLSDQMSGTNLFVLAIIAGLGLAGPDLFLRQKTDKRQTEIARTLPDAFDLLVICADAGLSLDAALDRVSKEMKTGCPDLAEELGLTCIELSFLPDRRTAFEGLAERVPLAGIRALTNTFLQTEKFGTPLAQALKVMASDLRTERMMKAEEKAARLPAILTVPMIVFIMPPLIIVLIGPAILRTIDAMSAL